MEGRIKLNKQQHKEFHIYTTKMEKASNWSEMRFFYKKALGVIKEAKRKKDTKSTLGSS